MKAGAYVHIPYCRKKCAYCAFTSTAGAVSEQYIDALIREIDGSAYTDLTFDTVFFGGGTPSLLPSGATKRIIDAIGKKFSLDPVEITVEGNPESLTQDKLNELKSAGVNRISIGVQSLDDDCLKQIGRIHDKATALKALENACNTFDNVSVDMMLGLPGRHDLKAELLRLTEFPISHLSAYMLTLEEGTPLMQKAHDGKIVLPSEDDAVAEYDLVKAVLESKGFNRYEVSNFAKKGRECRHNLKYWQRKPYLGFGVAAHSCVGDKRFFNTDSTDAYLKGTTLAGEECVDKRSAMFESVMLGLRLDQGLNRKDFLNDYGVDVCAQYKEQIARVRDKLEITADYVRVKPEFTCVLNSILVEFME